MNNKQKRGELFLIFIIFSIFGSFYEQLLSFITCLIHRNQFIWIRNSSLILGYFRPVYGLGALLYTIFLKKRYSLLKNFLLSSLIGGSLEYIVSFLQELIFKTVTWDYSNKILNIGGRTTLIFAFFWGILGIIYIKYIYPYISKFIKKVPFFIKEPVIIVLIIFLTYNTSLSFSILLRQRLRNDGYFPLTKIGKLYDIKFNDAYLDRKFPFFINK